MGSSAYQLYSFSDLCPSFRGAAQGVMLLGAQMHISVSHFYSSGRSVVKHFNDIFLV